MSYRPSCRCVTNFGMRCLHSVRQTSTWRICRSFATYTEIMCWTVSRRCSILFTLAATAVVNGYKMEKELEKLQRQLAMAIKERRYARMAELQRKIAALQNVREHVPLSFLLPKFTPQERDKALVLMHQVFVFADMLYGAALEFEEYLKGFDRSVTLPVVVRAKKAAAECRDITRYVDSFGDERMSALFGEMCDEISLNAQNVIYRYVRKETKKQEP